MISKDLFHSHKAMLLWACGGTVHHAEGAVYFMVAWDEEEREEPSSQYPYKSPPPNT